PHHLMNVVYRPDRIVTVFFTPATYPGIIERHAHLGVSIKRYIKTDFFLVDHLVGYGEPAGCRSKSQDRTIITPEVCNPGILAVMSGFDQIHNDHRFIGLGVKL